MENKYRKFDELSVILEKFSKGETVNIENDEFIQTININTLQRIEDGIFSYEGIRTESQWKEHGGSGEGFICNGVFDFNTKTCVYNEGESIGYSHVQISDEEKFSQG